MRARGGIGVIALVSAALSGCDGGQTDDSDLRRRWVHEQAVNYGMPLREALNGSAEIRYYDGWYNLEHDPKTGGAWRWMDKRGTIRLRTKPFGLHEATDMELHVYGWVPHEDVAFRACHLEFSINGHVLSHFEPPPRSFEHTIIVPRWLLANSDWVDFVITAANTARPRGDWRDLGFATTGFIWKPVGSS